MAAWVQERIPNFIGWNGYYQAIGMEQGGELKGGVVYTSASPRNIMTTIALDAPMTKRFLYSVFWYPFEQLKVHRLTALVEHWNKKSLLFCKKVGFRVEGRLHEAASDGGDIIVLWMPRRECRFLEKSP